MARSPAGYRSTSAFLWAWPQGCCLQTAENVELVREEERTINGAIESGKMRTVDGREVRVAFEFGEVQGGD